MKTIFTLLHMHQHVTNEAYDVNTRINWHVEKYQGAH
jgi:hypothetical protein